MPNRRGNYTMRKIADFFDKCFKAFVIHYIALCLVLIVSRVRYDWFVGYGESMMPTFPILSVNFIDKKAYDSTDPEIGDIVTYRYPFDDGTPSLICHRIVGKWDDGTYMTQGDNRVTNDVPDETHVSKDMIVGKYIRSTTVFNPVLWHLPKIKKFISDYAAAQER